jgi:hypothetical protein
MKTETQQSPSLHDPRVQAHLNYERAYGRAWEAVLAALAGAHVDFINNEFREAGLHAGSAVMGIPDTYQRLMVDFLIDLPRCRFSKAKHKRALAVFRNIFRHWITDEVYAASVQKIADWDAEAAAAKAAPKAVRRLDPTAN